MRRFAIVGTRAMSKGKLPLNDLAGGAGRMDVLIRALMSSVLTSHGMRSISGVDIGLDINSVSQQQLESIPGIGKKAAWRIISSRAKASRNSKTPFDSVEMAFEMAGVDLSPIAQKVLSI